MSSTPTTEAGDLHAYATTGDEAAFRRIVERHAAMVHSVALRMTQDHGLAQEITQNVFSILARKARFLGTASLGGWLHRVAAAESRNARRKAARRTQLHQRFSATLMTTPEPARNASWEEIFPELDAAVSRLPAEDRELVVLRYFEKRSFREIAHATGRAEAACRKKSQRALELLSALLRKRGILAPGATALAALLAAQALTPSSASAAVIAATALQSVPASSGFTLFLKTLLSMTTKNIVKATLIALVLVAVPLAIVFKPEPLPRLAAGAPPAPRPTATAGKSGPAARPLPPPSDINWQEVGRKLEDSNDLTRMLLMKKLEGSFKTLTAAELEDGLEQVTNSDLSDSAKSDLRMALAGYLAKLDPMAVLARFPRDHAADLSWQLTAGIRELAKKDFTAADQWMKTQIADGAFSRTDPTGRPAQLDLYLGTMYGEALKSDPVEGGKKL
ncbi:MAG: polymerase, sigma-24 subunit, subfamily, partial [Akkermansiaceae bacterium]|nr:polymerase, sigma-24 subunit, subfamily [Akkermansiaceae bacterium]